MTRAVLVVDDELDVRELVAVVLAQVGFDVRTAASGVDALDRLAAATRPPDLVVLDVQMPDLDGWDTLAAIRARRQTEQVPVLLCTVRSHPSDVERGWRLGCDGFVRKPFAIDALAAEANAIVARSDDERRAVRAQKVSESTLGSTGPLSR